MTLAFVTGGSRGLGLATAEALNKDGVEVVLFATDGAKLQAAAAKLNGNYRIVDMWRTPKKHKTGRGEDFE